MQKFYIFLCLLAALAGTPRAWALQRHTSLADYHHDIWTGKDGAPGEVSAMAQTADGWLWIGSSHGLYRFDGVRFRRLEALPGEVAPRRPVTALTALANGDLLIGHFYGGVSVLSKGHLSHTPTMVDKVLVGAVYSMVRDRDGVLWASTTTGLLQLRDGAWHEVGKALGLPAGGRTTNLILDQYDQLWLAVGKQLMVLPRGAARFRKVLEGYVATNLSASPDGRLWLDTHGQLVPVPPQHGGAQLPRQPWQAQAEGQESGLFDRDGNYWTLACPGVCRTDGIGSAPSMLQRPMAAPDSRLDQPWQVSSLTANVLFEDRDGSIWIGTQAGVERFRNNRLLPVRLAGGERVFSFARDADGQVLAWAKPSGDLWRLRAGADPVVVERSPAGDFGVLGNGADGALLVAGVDHIERRYRGRVERIAYPVDPAVPGASASAVPVTRVMDDGRALWISIARRGTFRWQDGRWQAQSELGLPPGIFYAAPGAPGAMWFGYNDGVVLHYDNGKLTRHVAQGEHDIGAISFLHGGADVIAAGNTGLAVLRDGRWQRLNAADPDVLARVSGMVLGANGDRWFNGSKGAVQVRAADWRAALAAPQQPLNYVLHGVQDGYPGFAATANRMPSAIAGADGQLWFAGVGGIARLDGAQQPTPPQPPQARIETLVVQGQRHLDFARPLTLAAGTTAFRIEYTALSYTMPEALRFRYRLEGVDTDWQDPGLRRAVSYTNLGPGEYRFRLMAVDQFGQWSAEETMLLRIQPAFHQTPLFYALCAVAAAGLLYLLHRLWLRQATLRISTRMAERERIARALHDSYLQSVHGLTLSFQSALGGLPKDSAARQKIERVLLMADKVMEEGRNELLELRSGAMRDGDLAQGLLLVGEVLQESQRSVFSLRSSGTPRALAQQVACESYAIGREAIMNAFRHADAASVQVVLDYSNAEFTLEVLDDGKGIAADVVRHGRSGHWGLTGLFERAARIGGQMVVAPRAHGGTCVRLSVPAARAYAAAAPSGWRRWIRRLT